MKFKEIVDKHGNLLYGDLSGQTYDGGIDLYKKGLTSLDGCPKILYGDLFCDFNELTSLKGAPKEIRMQKGSKIKEVGASFSCSDNPKLKSFEYAPKLIEGSFFGRKTPLIKNPLEQIIKYQIKAKRYYIDEEGYDKDGFPYSDIKEMFEAETINLGVKRKGFRTLLGLDK